MAKAGRPTKLTPDLHAEVIRLIKAGNYLETAAAMVGVERPRLRVWVRRGMNEKRGRYHEFALDVEQAMAHAEAMDVLGIRKAGEREWTARAWLLERRFPTRWGRRSAEVKVNLVQSPAWQELRDMLAAALEPYPDAAEAVARVFETDVPIDVKALPEPTR